MLWNNYFNFYKTAIDDNIPDYQSSETIDGVRLVDDKVILKPIRSFMKRIWQLKDIMETMKQFNILVKSMKVLPLLTIIKEYCNSSDEESEDDSRTVSVASPDSLG